jgi:hypothetical protein
VGVVAPGTLVAVAVAVGVGDMVPVAAGVAVIVAVGVGLMVAVTPGVPVAIAVAVGDMVAVAPGVPVTAIVAVGLAVVVAPGVPVGLGLTMLKLRTWMATMTLELVTPAIGGFGAGADVWAAPVAVGVGVVVAPPGWTVTVTVSREISGMPAPTVAIVRVQAGRTASRPTRITVNTFLVVNVGCFI